MTIPARSPKNTVINFAFSLAFGNKSKNTTASIKPDAKHSAYLTYLSCLRSAKIAINAPKISPKKANKIDNILCKLILKIMLPKLKF